MVVYALRMDGDVVTQMVRYDGGEVIVPPGYVEVDAETWGRAAAGATRHEDGTFTLPPPPPEA
jgi:hypothetical protein